MGVDHRTQKRLAGGSAGCDQSRDTGVGQSRLECRLRARGIRDVEDQDGGLTADAEGPQPAAKLLDLEPLAERVGEQIAREAALGFAHDPLAHQLEPDHHRCLAGAEALEVTKRGFVGDDPEPGDGIASTAAGNRNRKGAAGEVPLRRECPQRPVGNVGGELGRERRGVLGTRRGAVEPARELAASAVEDDRRSADRRRRRSKDLLQSPALDHQPLEALVHLGAAVEHIELLVDQMGRGALVDRDERHLVRDLEQGQVVGSRGIEQGLRQALVVEACSEPESGDLLGREQLDISALPGG